jgi:hypothetical protein
LNWILLQASRTAPAQFDNVEMAPRQSTIQEGGRRPLVLGK